jgi:hypothetical protein
MKNSDTIVVGMDGIAGVEDTDFGLGTTGVAAAIRARAQAHARAFGAELGSRALKVDTRREGYAMEYLDEKNKRSPTTPAYSDV